MNKHFARKWLLPLSVVLAASGALAACGGGSTGSGNGGASPGSGSGSGGDGGNESAVNKKIDILLSHSNGKYAQQVKSDDPYIKALSEISGYDLSFEFLGHGNDFTQQLTVRFASGDLPDLIRTNSIDSTMHPGALQQGVFHDLTDLIEEHGPHLKERIPAEAWNSPKVSQDGKIYGIPTLLSLPATHVLYFREDWLEKLNMDIPQTMDEFLAYFEAVKNEDLNGNGQNDEYGFYIRENLSYGNVFFRNFGASPDQWYLRDGQLIPGMILPEMKDAIAFHKELYDKGYINPNLFTIKSADWEADIKQGKAGMWMHSIPNYMSNWQPGNFVNQPDVKLAVAGPPEGGGLSAEGDQIYFVWVIPSQVDNPEEIIKFLDWAWSDEADSFFSFGIEGVNYTEENGSVQWDPTAPANLDNDASVFYQLSINPRGDGRMNQSVVDVHPDSEILNQGIAVANDATVANDGIHMPPLESLKTHPELAIGTNSGTLFLDMFAKVVTGNADLDEAFDSFVSEWKRRGGDAAIQEATEWYNEFHK
ncbi:extracellular solute-binding protein [Paenibacillus senegalensis]|uniref:extracellular solute-binding protein n=1 Tax=Paenibacillus senegalensis TaxID=1465766 RepID=UPI000288D0D7|nr:extracellular solute-binding protein [Paenibacillus senegalensis]